MRARGDIFERIGKTPIVGLPRLSEAAGAEILAKVELGNPGGSIKDRVGLAMVAAAEAEGRLAPGATIVEATAGNTGIALAWIAAARGYRFVAVMSEADRGPKVDTMEAMGAEVVLAAADRAWNSPEGPIGTARRLVCERGGVFLDQFTNPANPRVHERTTAAEIRRTLGDRLDAVVVGVGTGGTATGLARALKPAIPGLRVIGVVGVGSYLGNGRHGERIPGITPDFEAAVFERGLVDRIETPCPGDAARAARCLAEVEGLEAGHSSGACLLAAENEARRRPGSRILVIVADSARNYPAITGQREACPNAAPPLPGKTSGRR